MKKITSGISGFEEITGGGLSSGEICLLTGPTGTGKTVFGMTFLSFGLQKNEKALYVSIGKSKKKVFTYFSAFNFNVEKKKENLKILEIDSLDVLLKAEYLNIIREFNPKRIVLDSIPDSPFTPETEKLVFSLLSGFESASVVVCAKTIGGSRVDLYADMVLSFGVTENEGKAFGTAVVLKHEGASFEHLIYETAITKDGFTVKEALDESTVSLNNRIKKIPIICVTAGRSIEARKGNEFHKKNISEKNSYIDLQIYSNPQSIDSIISTMGQINILGQQLCRFQEFVKQDLLLDLNTVTAGPLAQKMLDVFMKPFIIDNQLFGVPANVEVGILVYRKNLMKKYRLKVPESLEDMVSACKYVAERENDITAFSFTNVEDGYAVGRVFLEYLSVYNGRVYADDGKVIFNNKSGQDALKFLCELFSLHGVVGQRKDTEAYYFLEKIYSGKFFIAHCSTDIFLALRSGRLIDSEIGYFKIPGGKSFVDASFYGVPAEAKYKETTAAVLETLIHPVNAKKLYDKNLAYDLIPNKEFYNKEVMPDYLDGPALMQNSFWITEIENSRQTLEIIGNEVKKLIFEGKGNVREALQRMTENISRIGEEKYSQRILREAEKYVAANLRSAGIKDTAAALKYSPDHFGRIFKEKKGITFSEYITEVRLAKAAEFIRKDFRKNIDELASECGYESAKHFRKLFKNRFKLSPSEYRLKQQ